METWPIVWWKWKGWYCGIHVRSTAEWKETWNFENIRLPSWAHWFPYQAVTWEVELFGSQESNSRAVHALEIGKDRWSISADAEFSSSPFLFCISSSLMTEVLHRKACNSILTNKNVTSAWPGDVHQEKGVYSDDVWSHITLEINAQESILDMRRQKDILEEWDIGKEHSAFVSQHFCTSWILYSQALARFLSPSCFKEER